MIETRKERAMPDHIKLILRHAAFGGLIAAGFVGLLLAFNVANLWHLVSHSADGVLALAVMFTFFWITFGSVQIGIRIMMMAEDSGSSGGTRAPQAVADLVPVRVQSDDAPRRATPRDHRL
jgi:hypothetical protein